MLAAGQLPLQLSLATTPTTNGGHPSQVANKTLIDKSLIDSHASPSNTTVAPFSMPSVQPNVATYRPFPSTSSSIFAVQSNNDFIKPSFNSSGHFDGQSPKSVVQIDSQLFDQPLACATASDTTATTPTKLTPIIKPSLEQSSVHFAKPSQFDLPPSTQKSLPAQLINSIRSQLLAKPLHRIQSAEQRPLDGKPNVSVPLSLPCSPVHAVQQQQQPSLSNHQPAPFLFNNNHHVNKLDDPQKIPKSLSATTTPPPLSPPALSSTQPLTLTASSNCQDQLLPSAPGGGAAGGGGGDCRRFNREQNSLPLPRARRATKRHRRKRPPDGGWGWVVVFASFFISVVADGVAFSFGTIYVELIKHFGASKSRTAWVGSLFFSMPLLAGPVASALTDRYGCRLVTIASGVIASIGFLLSSYVQSLELLYVTFSLSGCGLALSYVTGIVIVAHYFEKRRSLATGLAVCGTGIGTFLFPPLTIYLLERFQWQGTLQIHALLFLVIIFCGFLMKDLNSPSRRLSRKSKSTKSSTLSSSSFATSSSSSSSVSSSSSDSSSTESSTSSDCESSSVTPTTNANTCISSSCDSFNSRTSTSKETGQKTSTDPFLLSVSKRPRSMSTIDLPTFLHHPTELGRPITVERPLSPVLSSLSPPMPNLDEPSPPLQRMLVQSLRKRPYFDRLVDLYPSLRADHPLLVPNPPTPPSASNQLDSVVVQSKAPSSPPQQGDKTTNDGKQNHCPHHKSKSKFRFTRSTRHWQSAGALVSNRTPAATATENNSDNKDSQLTSSTPRCPKCKPRSHTLTDQAHATRPAHAGGGSVVGPSARSFPQQMLQSLVGRQTGNYFRHIKVKRDSISYRTAMLNTNRYRLKASSCPDIYRNSLMTLHHQHEKSGFLNLMKQFLHHILDISLLKNCRFTLFCISNSFLYACIDIPYIYMPEYAIQAGSSDKRASYLISVVGIVNTLGIVIVGYIGDKTWIHTPNLYSLLTVVSGVAIFLLPIIKTYEGMLTLAALYGFSISVNYTLISVILVDILTIERFTSGYGLLLLIQGISSLIGPPIAGWLFDISGSYNTTFFVTGICIMISGVIVLPVEKRNKCNVLLRRCNSRPESDNNSVICKAMAIQSSLLPPGSNPNMDQESNQRPIRRSIRIDENVKFDKN